jgi:hemerythrin-like domain-containing protein
MRHATIDVIREEHQALSAMLHSIPLLMMQARRQGRLPDFELLRAMLFYVDEFPERLHHPKEDALLFPRLRQRCPELAPVLDRLHQEHASSRAALHELQHTLLAYEMMGEPRRVAFEQALAQYTRFYLEHMGTEETQLLPAAMARLQPEDWVELDAAFADNRDPLAGHEPAPDYRPLFSRIVGRAPAPIGLGPTD